MPSDEARMTDEDFKNGVGRIRREAYFHGLAERVVDELLSRMEASTARELELEEALRKAEGFASRVASEGPPEFAGDALGLCDLARAVLERSRGT